MSRLLRASLLSASALFLGGCFFFGDGCPDDAPPPEQLAALDLDRDGTEGSIDCDDDDPALHPGAFDIPDDGIDQDCNGFDATVHDEATACQRARPAFFGANTGDTTRGLAVVPPTCGPTAESSVVYLLTSEVPARVTLSVESDTPHTLHARNGCVGVTVERGCVEPGGAPLMLDFMPNVPVYVVVSATETPGPFVLHASRVSLIP